MREMPDGVTESDVLSALRDGWAVEPGEAEFLPLGAGSYNWRAGPYFVKVDDLRFKSFPELRQSLETAARIGLDFVLAPLPSIGGEVVRRLDHRYAISLYPLVDGVAGEFGPHRPEDLPDLRRMLTALHAVDPGDAPRFDPAIPGRDELFTGPCRDLLESHRDKILGWFAEFDRLAASVSGDDWVLTHGEPHPGNLLRSGDRLWLIDWDTVAVAPPERDWWLLGPSAPGDPDRLELFRQRWRLLDIVLFAADEDLEYLNGYLSGE